MDEPKGKDAMFFVFGTLVGAAVVALSSPYKGHEVREKLRHQVHKMKSKGNNIADNMADDIKV
jgi:gas vesicle protein